MKPSSAVTVRMAIQSIALIVVGGKLTEPGKKYRIKVKVLYQGKISCVKVKVRVSKVKSSCIEEKSMYKGKKALVLKAKSLA